MNNFGNKILDYKNFKFVDKEMEGSVTEEVRKFFKADKKGEGNFKVFNKKVNEVCKIENNQHLNNNLKVSEQESSYENSSRDNIFETNNRFLEITGKRVKAGDEANEITGEYFGNFDAGFESSFDGELPEKLCEMNTYEIFKDDSSNPDINNQIEDIFTLDKINEAGVFLETNNSYLRSERD